jgi:hypothetical protein
MIHMVISLAPNADVYDVNSRSYIFQEIDPLPELHFSTASHRCGSSCNFVVTASSLRSKVVTCRKLKRIIVIRPIGTENHHRSMYSLLSHGRQQHLLCRICMPVSSSFQDGGVCMVLPLYIQVRV